MMDFKTIIELLQEFHYEKNGIDLTIEFLEFIIHSLKDIKENNNG